MLISSTINCLIGCNFDLFLVLILLGNVKKTSVTFLWVLLHFLPHSVILKGIKLLFSHFGTGGNSLEVQ